MSSGSVSEHYVDGSSEEHVIQMSLFVGYTSDESIKQTKIMRLVEESQNCGILDTGCSTTVCGQRWLNNYLSDLCDKELAMVREGNSSATFTFGDGVRSEVTTDVVECDLPLLISKQSMKKGKMVLNFSQDSVKIMDKWVKLMVASSGHYMLLLYL